MREAIPAPPTAGPLPAGLGVALDRRTIRAAHGRLLVGGAPTRLVRLTAAGAGAVDRWSVGGRPESAAERALARRLTAAGLAHPLPPPAAAVGEAITIVVPVRDRQPQLARCLAALDPHGARVIVVDDGSAEPTATASVAARHGAEVVRHDRSRGAAAARNAGAARCETPLIAFVDSDCQPTRGWLPRLAGHLADPQVAAAAPRIVAAPSSCATLVGRYEAGRSSLDMGPSRARVMPLGSVPYVPSAVLVVRRAAFGAGFDEQLAIGEDVDLVWRMHAAGWTVRYDPAVLVAHEHRQQLLPWLRRRFVYGTSAAPLARRHPGQIPAAVLTPASATVLGLLALRRPGAATAVVGLQAVGLRRRLAGGAPVAVTARLVAAGSGWSAWSLAVALTRTWLPLSLVAASRSRRVRRLLLVASAARVVELARQPPPVPVAAAVALGALDDAAYAAGLWWGALREREAGALAPKLAGRLTSRHPR